MTFEQMEKQAVQNGMRAHVAKDGTWMRIGYKSNYLEITAAEWAAKDVHEQMDFYLTVERMLKAAQ